MASETFVSAMMLITAVVASAILITAVFPIVWNMVSTFSSASHDTDTRMRTDFKIVVTYAHTTPRGDVYLKNIGSNPIGMSEVNKSDVVFGKKGQFERLTFNPLTIDSEGQWTYVEYNGVDSSYDFNKNQVWDKGETLHIAMHPHGTLALEDTVYFEFVLPNGVVRTSEFTVS